MPPSKTSHQHVSDEMRYDTEKDIYSTAAERSYDRVAAPPKLACHGMCPQSRVARTEICLIRTYKGSADLLREA